MARRDENAIDHTAPRPVRPKRQTTSSSSVPATRLSEQTGSSTPSYLRASTPIEEESHGARDDGSPVIDESEKGWSEGVWSSTRIRWLFTAFPVRPCLTVDYRSEDSGAEPPPVLEIPVTLFPDTTGGSPKWLSPNGAAFLLAAVLSPWYQCARQRRKSDAHGAALSVAATVGRVCWTLFGFTVRYFCAKRALDVKRVGLWQKLGIAAFLASAEAEDRRRELAKQQQSVDLVESPLVQSARQQAREARDSAREAPVYFSTLPIHSLIEDGYYYTAPTMTSTLALVGGYLTQQVARAFEPRREIDYYPSTTNGGQEDAPPQAQDAENGGGDDNDLSTSGEQQQTSQQHSEVHVVARSVELPGLTEQQYRCPLLHSGAETPPSSVCPECGELLDASNCDICIEQVSKNATQHYVQSLVGQWFRKCLVSRLTTIGHLMIDVVVDGVARCYRDTPPLLHDTSQGNRRSRDRLQTPDDERCFTPSRPTRLSSVPQGAVQSNGRLGPLTINRQGSSTGTPSATPLPSPIPSDPPQGDPEGRVSRTASQASGGSESTTSASSIGAAQRRHRSIGLHRHRREKQGARGRSSSGVSPKNARNSRGPSPLPYGPDTEERYRPSCNEADHQRQSERHRALEEFDAMLVDMSSHLLPRATESGVRLSGGTTTSANTAPSPPLEPYSARRSSIFPLAFRQALVASLPTVSLYGKRFVSLLLQVVTYPLCHPDLLAHLWNISVIHDTNPRQGMIKVLGYAIAAALCKELWQQHARHWLLSQVYQWMVGRSRSEYNAAHARWMQQQQQHRPAPMNATSGASPSSSPIYSTPIGPRPLDRSPQSHPHAVSPPPPGTTRGSGTLYTPPSHKHSRSHSRTLSIDFSHQGSPATDTASLHSGSAGLFPRQPYSTSASSPNYSSHSPTKQLRSRRKGGHHHHQQHLPPPKYRPPTFVHLFFAHTVTFLCLHTFELLETALLLQANVSARRAHDGQYAEPVVGSIGVTIWNGLAIVLVGGSSGESVSESAGNDTPIVRQLNTWLFTQWLPLVGQGLWASFLSSTLDFVLSTIQF